MAWQTTLTFFLTVLNLSLCLYLNTGLYLVMPIHKDPPNNNVRTLTAVVFINTINANLRGRLPDSANISSVLKDHERPFVKSFDSITDHKNKKLRKLITKIDVEKVIEKKIHQLKPELDEHKELFSGPEDDDQTSIIEFSPFPKSKVKDNNSPRPEKVKDAIDQYKNLRREIGNMLQKESVSVQTKHVVTRTLDRLISQMISSQCNLQNDVSNVPVKRSQDFLKMDKAEMLKSWTKKWQDLIKQYTIGSQDSDATGVGYKEMFLFLMRLREFFFQIHDELNMLNDRYMVKCKLTEKYHNKKSKESKDLRSRPSNREDGCKYVKICSDELKAFMMDSYANLKEIVEIVFKNYREMYKRDVTTDTSIEMRSFIKMLNEINDDVINEMNRSFRKEIKKMDMKQYNSTKDKLNILKKFTETNVQKVERISKKVLAAHLKPLEVKLRSTVTKDLLTSIGIELNNFKTEKIEKICLFFQRCNGNSTRRSSDSKDSFTFGRNNINVKLNIGIEDLSTLKKNLKNRRKVFKDTGNRHQRSNPKPPFDFRKYAHIKVTRTSHTTKDKKIYDNKPTTTTPRNTSTTTRTATRTSPNVSAIVAKISTYTYAAHVEIKTPSTTVGPTTTTVSTTTSAFMHFVEKFQAEVKTADLNTRRNSANNVLHLFGI